MFQLIGVEQVLLQSGSSVSSAHGNNNNRFFSFGNVRPLRPGKSHPCRSRKLLIASNPVRDGLVVPAIHIVRVALKTPISLAILGMLRSDSSTNLLSFLVSATSSNSFETVFLSRLRDFDLCVLASVATEAWSTDTAIHFARFTVTAEESKPLTKECPQ